jgi:hypothetical protein
MIYLSGLIRSSLVGKSADLGVMDNPASGNLYERSKGPWAVENACFAKGDEFSLSAYVARLESLRPYASTCLFAPAPDVVGDARATWERSKNVLPIIRSLGFKAALVAQDGIEEMVVEWDEFDVLFLGGFTRWKLSHHARDLTAEAKRRGKKVHMGRANSELRLRTAAMWGCDSVDGTFLVFGPDTNTPKLLGWLDRLQEEPGIVFGVAAA